MPIASQNYSQQKGRGSSNHDYTNEQEIKNINNNIGFSKKESSSRGASAPDVETQQEVTT